MPIHVTVCFFHRSCWMWGRVHHHLSNYLQLSSSQGPFFSLVLLCRCAYLAALKCHFEMPCGRGSVMKTYWRLLVQRWSARKHAMQVWLSQAFSCTIKIHIRSDWRSSLQYSVLCSASAAFKWRAWRIFSLASPLAGYVACCNFPRPSCGRNQTLSSHGAELFGICCTCTRYVQHCQDEEPTDDPDWWVSVLYWCPVFSLYAIRIFLFCRQCPGLRPLSVFSHLFRTKMTGAHCFFPSIDMQTL